MRSRWWPARNRGEFSAALGFGGVQLHVGLGEPFRARRPFHLHGEGEKVCAVEYGGFARAEKAGEDGDGEFHKEVVSRQ